MIMNNRAKNKNKDSLGMGNEGKSANKLCPSCKKVVSGQRVGNIEYLEHGTVRYCKHQECGHRWSTIEIQRDKYKEIQSRLLRQNIL